MEVFTPTTPEIPTKSNIKDTDSKGNILSPVYIPKGEGSDGSEVIRKYHVIKNVYTNPNHNKLFRIV